MPNQEQSEFWNGAAGDVWVEAQEQLDTMLEPLSDLALAQAVVSPGDRVIDIGCGCGATAIALAQKGAAVWGVDLSEPMLERARQRGAQAVEIEKQDLQLAFTATDAAQQSYTADHQLLFSRFGVMFFDDPVAAFTQLHTALTPSGRLLFVCWQSPKLNPWMSVPGRAIAPFMPKAMAEAPDADPKAPGPFAFADKDWIMHILSHAGFANVQIEAVSPQIKLGSSVDEALYFQGRVGPMARVLAELDEDTKAKATEAVGEALAEYLTDSGIYLESGAWIVSATRS